MRRRQFTPALIWVSAFSLFLVGCDFSGDESSESSASAGESAPASNSKTSSPQIRITVDWPGATPLEIEEQLAIPLERELSSVIEVDGVDTRISAGRCTMTLNHISDPGVGFARVREVFDSLSSIPESVEEPIIDLIPSLGHSRAWLIWEPDDETIPTMTMARQIRDRVIRIANVGSVEIQGAGESYIEIAVDGGQLVRYAVPYRSVRASIDEFLISAEAERDAVPAHFDIERLSNLAIVAPSDIQSVRVRTVAVIRNLLHFEARAHREQRAIVRFEIRPNTDEVFNEMCQDIRDQLGKWREQLDLRGVLELVDTRERSGTVVDHQERPIVRMLFDPRKTVVVQICGSEFAVLNEWLKEIVGQVAAIDGVVDVSTEGDSMSRQVKLDLDFEKLAAIGLNHDEITELVGDTFRSGPSRNEMARGVAVRFHNRETSFDEFLALTLSSQDGAQIPLSAVAEIKMVIAPELILRSNGKRAMQFWIQTPDPGVCTRVRGEIHKIIERSLPSPENKEYEFDVQRTPRFMR